MLAFSRHFIDVLIVNWQIIDVPVIGRQFGNLFRSSGSFISSCIGDSRVRISNMAFCVRGCTPLWTINGLEAEVAREEGE